MKFDYSGVIKKSWEVAWKYKILWIFGFFTGWGGAANFNINLPREEKVSSSSLELKEFLAFIQEHLALIIFIASFFFLLTILLLIARYISKPALIFLASKCEEVKPTFSAGLSSGLKFLFRYIATGWILWLPFILLISPLLIIFSLFLIKSNFGEPSSFNLLTLIFLLLSLLILILIIGIPLTILTEIAHRYLVIENAGVFNSISNAFSFLKTFWKNVALLWLINMALGFAAGIALIFIFLLLLLPLLPVGFGLVATLSSHNLTPLFILIPIGLILLLVIITFFILAQGLMGTFFTNYWTFAYLKLKELKEEKLAQETSPQTS